MSPSLVAEYLALREDFEGEAPVDAPPRAAPDTTSTPRRDEIGAQSGAHAPAEP